MTVWDDVVGQPTTVQRLADAAQAARAAAPGSRMSHAWLFTGPPGSGRSVAARAFAAALLCSDPVEAGCGRCTACRTALSGTHADVTVLATEETVIRRQVIEPLIGQAQRRPWTGAWRVMLVEDADRLNDTSAAMLLKSVEEPPERTVWLLCAPGLDDVLPTIRSRCRHVGLRIPPSDAIAALLQRRDGIDPPMAAFAAQAAQGHIGLARRLARDEDARIRRRAVLRLPLRLTGVGDAVEMAAELLAAAQQDSKDVSTERDAAERAALLRTLGVTSASGLPPALRTQLRTLEEDQKRRARRAQTDVLDRALVDLMSLYRDLLLVQMGVGGVAGGVRLVNADLDGDIRRLAARGHPEQTLAHLDTINLARERIAGNVAPLLALEAMFLGLLGR